METKDFGANILVTVHLLPTELQTPADLHDGPDV